MAVATAAPCVPRGAIGTSRAVISSTIRRVYRALAATSSPSVEKRSASGKRSRIQTGESSLALERPHDRGGPLERTFHVGARVRAGREARALASGEEFLQVADDTRCELVLAEAIADRVCNHGTGWQIELRGEVVADGARQGIVEGGVVAGTELLAGAGERLPRRPPGAGEARVEHVARQA